MFVNKKKPMREIVHCARNKTMNSFFILWNRNWWIYVRAFPFWILYEKLCSLFCLANFFLTLSHQEHEETRRLFSAKKVRKSETCPVGLSGGFFLVPLFRRNLRALGGFVCKLYFFAPQKIFFSEEKTHGFSPCEA